MKRLIVFVALAIWVFPTAAYAHGVDINYQTKTAVEIEAMYDTGDPVSGGQVTIYAPNDPSKPWATGKADESGRFVFAPDPLKTGSWDVQVRLAGHGGMVHIPIDNGNAAAPAAAGYSTMQIIIMSASVIWGFIGTALYFARRKN